MRKIILCLFITLFCFSIGIAELQEEELSKEERAKIEKKIERLKKEKKELHDIFNYLFEKFETVDKEIDQLEMKIQGKDLLQLMKEASEEKPERDVLEIMFQEDKKKKFAWLDKYPDLAKKEEQKKELSYWDGYEAAAVDYFKSLGVWKTDPGKLEEENDRLEYLLEEIRNERFNLEIERSDLEWDMIRYRSEMEMLWVAPELHPLFFGNLYYPGYSRQINRTNYEPFLFTLSTDSKGKIDWTKYGWLKLLLNKK